MPRKNKFSSLLLTVGIFTSGLKDNESIRRHKMVIIKIFQNFVLVDGRIRIRPYKYGSGSGGPQKLTDPDPQHWFLVIIMVPDFDPDPQY
jgi:hypothetical protein